MLHSLLKLKGWCQDVRHGRCASHVKIALRGIVRLAQQKPRSFQVLLLLSLLPLVVIVLLRPKLIVYFVITKIIIVHLQKQDLP